MQLPLTYIYTYLWKQEVARTVQEKEKKKYEKYVEKQRLKELKSERKILEKQLEQHTQDARLTLRSSQEAGTSDEGNEWVLDL